MKGPRLAVLGQCREQQLPTEAPQSPDRLALLHAVTLPLFCCVAIAAIALTLLDCLERAVLDCRAEGLQVNLVLAEQGLQVLSLLFALLLLLLLLDVGRRHAHRRQKFQALALHRAVPVTPWSSCVPSACAVNGISVSKAFRRRVCLNRG